MKKKKREKLKLSTVRLLVYSVIALAMVIMFSYTYATGVLVKQAEEVASADVFKNCSFQTVDGGKFGSEDIAASKLTVINVWQTTCGPCVSEMPTLQQLSEEYDSSEVQIVGLCLDVTPGGQAIDETRRTEELRILDETGAQFTQILADEELFSFTAAHIAGTPTSIVLDSRGTIVKIASGGMDYDGWKGFIDSYRK